jgi:hypothetical protein
MFSRSRIFIVVAILLTMILLGMTPLNFAQKIRAGCPFFQGKQLQRCNPCPFHSLVSQENHETADLPRTLYSETSTPFDCIRILHNHSILSLNPSGAIPLRC